MSSEHASQFKNSKSEMSKFHKETLFSFRELYNFNDYYFHEDQKAVTTIIRRLKQFSLGIYISTDSTEKNDNTNSGLNPEVIIEQLKPANRH